MATAPVQLDEKALIEAIIAETDLPEGVRFKHIRPMTEWTGEPAWRITLSVSKSIPLTKRRLEDLRRVQNAIRERIFTLKLDKWPFFQLIDSK